MKIKDLIAMEEKMSKVETLFEAISGGDITSEYSEAKRSLEANALRAKEVITAKFTEEQAVRAMEMVEKTVVAIMSSQGDQTLLAAQLSGALQTYTHTIVLTMMGVFMEEEVI